MSHLSNSDFLLKRMMGTIIEIVYVKFSQILGNWTNLFCDAWDMLITWVCITNRYRSMFWASCNIFSWVLTMFHQDLWSSLRSIPEDQIESIDFGGGVIRRMFGTSLKLLHSVVDLGTAPNAPSFYEFALDLDIALLSTFFSDPSVIRILFIPPPPYITDCFVNLRHDLKYPIVLAQLSAT